jgi:hypothetical protein
VVFAAVPGSYFRGITAHTTKCETCPGGRVNQLEYFQCFPLLSRVHYPRSNEGASSFVLNINLPQGAGGRGES